MIRGKRPALLAWLLAVFLLVGAAQSGVVVAQQSTTDVERAQERLQEANRAYQTALAVVDAAHAAGADTRDLDERLAASHEALASGVDAVRRTPPNADRAVEAAARAELLALAVEADAEAVGRQAVADAAVDAEAARLADAGGDTAPATTVWLRQAGADAADSRFDAVERDLLFAQHATQFGHYDAYLANLSAQGIHLTALERNLTVAEASLDDGTLTPADATRLRQSFVRADACVGHLHRATVAIERANRTSSVLVVVDVDTATTARQQGYDALERGAYDTACSHARTATAAATAEAQRVRATLGNDIVARAVDVVYDALRGFVAQFDDDTASTTAVHLPVLTLVDVRPVSVAFDPPSPTVTPLDFAADAVEIPAPPTADERTEATASESVEETADDAETADDERVRFVIRIDRVTECGTTCRDVTGTLRNAGTGDAHNVEVDTELSVDGDVIWTGSDSFGTVPAGETRTVDQRITLGFREALQAQSSGRVDVVITVRSDEHTQTIRDTIDI